MSGFIKGFLQALDRGKKDKNHKLSRTNHKRNYVNE
jgi:hypothetical protein